MLGLYPLAAIPLAGSLLQDAASGVGAFVLNGLDVVLAYDRLFTTSVATFIISGQAASFVRTYDLSNGTYILLDGVYQVDVELEGRYAPTKRLGWN